MKRGVFYNVNKQQYRYIRLDEGDEASYDITNEKMRCNNVAARTFDSNSCLQRLKLRND